jgi:hypothetical protein
MPRIKTTRTVKIALWGLRIYLFVLVALIGIKFIRMYHHVKSAEAAQSAVQQAPVHKAE